MKNNNNKGPKKIVGYTSRLNLACKAIALGSTVLSSYHYLKKGELPSMIQASVYLGFSSTVYALYEFTVGERNVDLKVYLVLLLVLSILLSEVLVADNSGPRVHKQMASQSSSAVEAVYRSAESVLDGENASRFQNGPLIEDVNRAILLDQAHNNFRAVASAASPQRANTIMSVSQNMAPALTAATAYNYASLTSSISDQLSSSSIDDAVLEMDSINNQMVLDIPEDSSSPSELYDDLDISNLTETNLEVPSIQENLNTVHSLSSNADTIHENDLAAQGSSDITEQIQQPSEILAPSSEDGQEGGDGEVNQSDTFESILNIVKNNQV